MTVPDLEKPAFAGFVLTQPDLDTAVRENDALAQSPASA